MSTKEQKQMTDAIATAVAAALAAQAKLTPASAAQATGLTRMPDGRISIPTPAAKAAKPQSTVAEDRVELRTVCETKNGDATIGWNPKGFFSLSIPQQGNRKPNRKAGNVNTWLIIEAACHVLRANFAMPPALYGTDAAAEGADDISDAELEQATAPDVL